MLLCAATYLPHDEWYIGTESVHDDFCIFLVRVERRRGGQEVQVDTEGTGRSPFVKRVLGTYFSGYDVLLFTRVGEGHVGKHFLYIHMLYS